MKKFYPNQTHIDYTYQTSTTQLESGTRFIWCDQTINQLRIRALENE